MSARVLLDAFDGGGDRVRRAAELAGAEARGYERGFADGLSQAASDRALEDEATDAAAAAIAETARTFTGARELFLDASARFAAEIVRAALPRLADRGLASEIASVVTAAARTQDGGILVEVSPEIADRLGEQLAGLEKIRVATASDLEGPRARARWAAGGADFDLVALERALDRICGPEPQGDRT